MKLLQRNTFRAALAAGLLSLGTAPASAQSMMHADPSVLPASPLAGGMAAAAGGQYMDAQGNPIILPVNYADPMGGYCDPMAMGGYGDPAAVDFGGYSTPDQVGPHYFDVATGTIWLQADELFGSMPALGSVGVDGPRILDPNSDYHDYEPGWYIALRHDLGPLSVIEATYFGLYDQGFSETVRSVDVAPGGVDFQLNSVFSGYGITPIDGFDEGSVYTLDYQANLQSTELTYRRYWVGASPRVSGTYILGARYLRLDEDLNFNTVALNGTGSIASSGTNDMVGFQLGADGWVGLRQGLRIGGEIKSGVYNNRYEFRRLATAPGLEAVAGQDGNQVAFAGEASLDVVADILPSWSLRGGYSVLYMNSLATVGANFPTDPTATIINTQGDALYHGFHGGVEYVW